MGSGRLAASLAAVAAGCSFAPPGSSGAIGDGPGSNHSSCTPTPPAVNVDPTPFDFATAPAWSCTSGTTTIDSMSAGSIANPCGGLPSASIDVAQTTGGTSVMVVPLSGLSVTGGAALHLQGPTPIVLLVAGDVLVDTGGSIDANATGATAGAGGSLGAVCTTQANGEAQPGHDEPGWGGGGGGFGTAGGQGGYDVTNGGFAVAARTLEPLRGGCAGTIGNTGVAGAGGGAFEISATGTITIGRDGAALLAARGGGAPGVTGNGTGGNGGGAGGGILLVSPEPVGFGSGGVVRANGGAGGAGIANGGGTGYAGSDGHTADDEPAVDASGTAGDGGNDDGRPGGIASRSGSGSASQPGGTTGPQTGGRGGGGGGGGLIVVTTVPAGCH
jgi:hypothetical protein